MGGNDFCVAILLIFAGNYANVQGQGAGPVGGSVADYYDQAFGNPFLGYWKNPGNKNPYGSHTAQTDANLYNGVYAGGGSNGRGSPYAYPFGSGMDRPAPAAASYLYNRMGPYAGNAYGGGSYGGGYGGIGGYPDPYMGMAPGYGAYGGGGYLGSMGGVGMYPHGDPGRTPADRGLQDLLPSSYAYKPWYP
ncbi:hypothetical protein BV898_18114 [Hypsibius exemplaris]|uniref:Uncharacterized protein n=1 Tax=Hypsibius exemplaris TaxID=2072580 RepID=A0A9X6RN64_HYPEX|nr:hypothetical protein BV898_18114 [Hypsibius exemplaris]